MATQSMDHEKYNFRCADVGPKDCTWEVSGSSERDLMREIETHSRRRHNLTIDDSTRERVRQAITSKVA